MPVCRKLHIGRILNAVLVTVLPGAPVVTAVVVDGHTSWPEGALVALAPYDVLGAKPLNVAVEVLFVMDVVPLIFIEVPDLSKVAALAQLGVVLPAAGGIFLTTKLIFDGGYVQGGGELKLLAVGS